MRGRFLPPFPTIHIIIPAVLALSASYFSGVSLVGDRVSYFALLVSMRSLSMVPGIIIRTGYDETGFYERGPIAAARTRTDTVTR